MRNRPPSLVVALAALCGCSCVALAQTKQPPKASAAAVSAHVPDLSGVWMQEHGRPAKVRDRYWIYEFSLDEPPMTPWAQEKYKATKASFGPHPVAIEDTNDPVYQACVPPGLPRIYLHPFPMQIAQIRGEVIMLFEYDSIRHQIFTDGRQHDETLGPLWMGDSVGHWEGDTLVADTVNFNDKTWLDRMGHPHSDALHLIERMRRVDHNHLNIDMTIDDPKAYTKPWIAHMEFTLEPKWTVGEYFCEDQETFRTFDRNAARPQK